MSEHLLHIATRKSPLALWQAHHVSAALQYIHRGLAIEFVKMTTQGDKVLDTPLAKIGGKGLFVKELEQGLLEGKADIAVHSMKDVPIDLPSGLVLSVILPRADPRDAFVSNQYNSLFSLPMGARVGTASLRRQSQLLALRPDLEIHPVRGNVGTRLDKLDKSEFDAIVLAAVGLQRLGLSERIRSILDIEAILPAIGQGAIGIECRQDDVITQSLIQPLNDVNTQQCLKAERAINRSLGGSCQVPIAGFAEVEGPELLLRGLVADIRGKQILRSCIRGSIEQAEELGEALAQDLLVQGANDILDDLII